MLYDEIGLVLLLIGLSAINMYILYVILIKIDGNAEEWVGV